VAAKLMEFIYPLKIAIIKLLHYFAIPSGLIQFKPVDLIEVFFLKDLHANLHEEAR
jgi:hypothetical protein